MFNNLIFNNVASADIDGFRIRIDDTLARDISKVDKALQNIEVHGAAAGQALMNFKAGLAGMRGFEGDIGAVADYLEKIKAAMKNMPVKNLDNVAKSLSAITQNVNSMSSDKLQKLFTDATNPAMRIFELVNNMAAVINGLQSRSLGKALSEVANTPIDREGKQKGSINTVPLKGKFESDSDFNGQMETLRRKIVEYFQSHPIPVKLDDKVNLEGFAQVRKDLEKMFKNISVTLKTTEIGEKGTKKTKEKTATSVENVPVVDNAEKKALDEVNEKLRTQIALLREKRNAMQGSIRSTGTGDFFIQGDIDSITKKIEELYKARHELLTKMRGVSYDESIAKANQTELELIKNIEKEGVARRQNIAWLTQMRSLLENILTKGQGVDMFSGMQQRIVDARGELEKLLKEQRTTTEQKNDRWYKEGVQYYDNLAKSRQKTDEELDKALAKADANREKRSEDLYYAEMQRLKSLYSERLRLEKESQSLSNKGTLNMQTGGKTAALSQDEIALAQKLREQITNNRSEIAGIISIYGRQEDVARAYYSYEVGALRQKVELQRQYNADLEAQRKLDANAKKKTDDENDKKKIDNANALNKLYQEQLQLKGKIGSLDNQRTIVSERSQGKITTLSPKQEQLAQEYAQQLKKVNKEIATTASLVGYVDRHNAAESTRIALLEQEIKLQQELDKALEKVYADQQKKADAANAGLSASQIKSMENEYARLLTQIDKVNAAKEKMNEKQGVAWQTGNATLFGQLSSGIRASEEELVRLNARKVELENQTELQLDKIRGTHERKRAEQAVKDFEDAEKKKTEAAKRVARERADEDKKTAQSYNKGFEAYYNTPKGATAFGEMALISKAFSDTEKAMKRLQTAMANVKPNTEEWNKMNTIYQQLKKNADEYRKAVGGIRTQSRSLMPTLNNLAMKFGIMFSVQQLIDWTKHMVEVRAQFELQNIALRSIIQNKEKADEVFAEVQQLALKSPFSIMQLNTYTKQIAAYGVEAEKLVGTTKMLADVSAGLGVDMGRLILAYGQVKTANFLRATEVRQFTEAGLNITQELANYFTELNGKMVRAADVTEMITKRMVKFEDVAEVFKRVTSAGGMFYNMQEKQAEGLHGQIQRIGDAYSIMLNKIGENNEGSIASVLAMMRELINNWRVVAQWGQLLLVTLVGYEAWAKRATILKFMKMWWTYTKGIKDNMTLTAMESMAQSAKTALTSAWVGLKKMLTETRNATAGVNVLKAAWTGLGTVVKTVGATLIGTVAPLALLYGVTMLVEKYMEWKAINDQIADSLNRINREGTEAFNSSAANYERLARTIYDSTKSYEERKDALEEIKRVFKDILPQEMLEQEYIISHANAWGDVTAAMRAYYAEQKIRKAEESIDEAYGTKYREGKKDVVEFTAKNVDIDKGTLSTFVDNVVKQIKKGTIKSTEEAVDEYLRQIEEYSGEKLKFREALAKPLTKSGMDDVFEIAESMREELEEATAAANNFATAQEKIDAEARRLAKSQSEGVQKVITDVNSGLTGLNALQKKIAQLEAQPQTAENKKQIDELKKSYAEAEASVKEMFDAMGLAYPDFSKVKSSVIDLRDAQANAATEIITYFSDGINPQSVELYQNWQRLVRVQKEITAENKKGKNADKERLDNLRSQSSIVAAKIRTLSKNLGNDIKDDIEKIAQKPQDVQKEFEKAADSSRTAFKKAIGDISIWVRQLDVDFSPLLDKLGRLLKLTKDETPKYNKGDIVGGHKVGMRMKKGSFIYEWNGEKWVAVARSSNNKVIGAGGTADTQKDSKISANEELRSLAKGNNYILNKSELWLKAGQRVEDYVKALKEAKESAEKIVNDYDKSTDKKGFLKRWGYTEQQIKDYRAEMEVAKQLAIKYDPNIFDKKSGKGSDNTEQLLRNRINLLKEANQMYEKLNKEYGKDISYQQTYNNLLARAKELGIKDIFDKDTFTNKSTLAAMEALYNKAGKGFNYFTKAFRKKYGNAVNELLKEIGEQKYQLAVDINEESREKINRQLDEMFGKYDLYVELNKEGVDSDIIKSLFDIDKTSITEIYDEFNKMVLNSANEAKRQEKADFEGFSSIEQAKAELGTKYNKMYADNEKKLTDRLEKEYETRIKSYLKYMKKSYSDAAQAQISEYSQLSELAEIMSLQKAAVYKRTDFVSEDERNAILKRINEEFVTITNAVREKSKEALDNALFQQFKEDPIFEELFGDLSLVSTKIIDVLYDKIEDLKGSLENLDPKKVKELVRLQQQLFAVKAERNPFKAYFESLEKVRDLRKKLKDEGISDPTLTLVNKETELNAINSTIDGLDVLIDLQKKRIELNKQVEALSEKDRTYLSTDENVLLASLSEKEIAANKLEERKETEKLNSEELDRLSTLKKEIRLIQKILSLKSKMSSQTKQENKELQNSPYKDIYQTLNEAQLLAEKTGQTKKAEEIKDLISKLKEYTDAEEEAASAGNKLGSTINAATDVANKGIDAWVAGMKMCGHSLTEGEQLWVSFAQQALTAIASITAGIIAGEIALNSASGIIGVIATALTLIAGLFSTIFGAHDSDLQEQIEETQRQVDKLQHSFENLKDSIDNAFTGAQLRTGTDEAIRNLEEQNKQYKRMIELERDKKDADEGKIIGYQNSIDDNIRKMKELREDYVSALGGFGSGADVAEASKNFVDAWTDAFGETAEGLSGLREDFDDYIKNIIKKQAYLKAAEFWIKPLTNKINNAFNKYGGVDFNQLKATYEEFKSNGMIQMDAFMEDFTKMFEDLFGMSWGDSASQLSGLAAGIQGVTEETAQVIEAMLNSMRFYVADTNKELKNIVMTLTNPPSDNVFLSELKAQTAQLEMLNKTLNGLVRAGHRMGGRGLKVFTN